VLLQPIQKISYDSENRHSVGEFNYTFEKASRLIGLPKAVLYMSCEDRDDFTVFVILRKKDKNGKDLMHLNFPFHATPIKSIDEIPEAEQASLNLHLGSMGILRASHQEIDSSRSIHPQFPFHPHKRQDKVSPGTIVKLEIGIWAMGVDSEEGESISVRVSNILHTAQHLKCTNSFQRLGVSIPALPSINHSRIPDQSTSSIGADMSSIAARNTPAPSFCPSSEECNLRRYLYSESRSVCGE
jgi:hypothetical protein